MITLRRETDVVGAVRLPGVNLLPPEIAVAAHLRRVQGGLGLGVAASVGLVGLLYVGAVGQVSNAEGQLRTTTAEQDQLHAEIATYHDVTAKYAAAAAAEQMLVQAMGSEVRYSRLLNDLSLTIPAGVWLTNATWTQGAAAGATAAATPGVGTVTLTGVATSHAPVAVWLEQLAAQRGYTAPYLQSSAEVLLDKKVVVNWSTTVTLTPDALSGRYAKTGS